MSLGQLTRVIFKKEDGQFGCVMTAYSRAELLELAEPVLTYSEYRRAVDQARIPAGAQIVRLIIGRNLYVVNDQSAEFHAQLAAGPLAPACQLEITYRWDINEILKAPVEPDTQHYRVSP